jgi:hypothetical protein
VSSDRALRDLVGQFDAEGARTASRREDAVPGTGEGVLDGIVDNAV